MKPDKGIDALPTGIVCDVIAILAEAQRSRRVTSRLKRKMSALEGRLRQIVASSYDEKVRLPPGLLREALGYLPSLVSFIKDVKELVCALMGQKK